MEQREIKFEYGFGSLNGIVKKHYYLHDIPNIQTKCDIWNVLPIIYVRQYAGLKDKNGVEIYEGDIVQYTGDGSIYFIEWHNEIAVFFLKSKSNGTDDCGFFFTRIFEINDRKS